MAVDFAESVHVTHVRGEHPFDILRGRYLRQQFAPHLHETFAIGAIEDGASRAAYGKTECVHPVGDVLVIEPNQVHTGGPVDGAGWSYRMFYVPTELMAGCIDVEDGHPRFARSGYHDPAMAGRMIHTHRFLESDEDALLKEQLLTEMLHDLCTRYRDNTESGVTTVPSEALLRVRDYLHEHYAEAICLADLSKLAGVSPFHLIRQFRRTFGLPPYAYLELVRVNRAKEMLQQGARISDVAFATRFSDQSHLTRRFKRVFGYPPGSYVKSFWNNADGLPHSRRRF
jgi:AraC-like DNA-binding protein